LPCCRLSAQLGGGAVESGAAFVGAAAAIEAATERGWLRRFGAA
jgi:hypothetical protein